MRTLLLCLCLLTLPAYAHTARHHTPAKHQKIISVFTARSYLVVDEDGNILDQKNSMEVRPIASITKLMLTYTILSNGQDLNEEIQIPETRTVSSHIPKSVTSLTRQELITLALIASDNFAAQILCDNLPNCPELMNESAQQIGMVNSHFIEGTGLDDNNVSTANDILLLLKASAEKATIMEIAHLATAEVEIIKIRNTNPLTFTLPIILTKTGYTHLAGGCMAMIVDSSIGKRFIILLGSRNTHTRVPEAAQLYKKAINVQ
jgi:D-alanyl-D-alanine endopeptidase (penicillin-binding protein 7)